MTIEYKCFNATKLWEIFTADGIASPKMNMNLVNIPNDFLTGFGIYAISYRDQNCPDSVIYLGSYAGNTPYAKQFAKRSSGALGTTYRYSNTITTC